MKNSLFWCNVGPNALMINFLFFVSLYPQHFSAYSASDSLSKYFVASSNLFDIGAHKFKSESNFDCCKVFIVELNSKCKKMKASKIDKLKRKKYFIKYIWPNANNKHALNKLTAYNVVAVLFLV